MRDKRRGILSSLLLVGGRARDVLALRTAAEACPIGIFLVREGKFLYVNPQFEQDTGYTQEEMMGRDSLALAVAEDRELVRASALKMVRGVEILPYRFKIRTKQGSLKSIQSSVTSISLEGRPTTLGFFMDITPETQALEVQKKQVQDLEMLLSIPMMLSQPGALDMKLAAVLKEMARVAEVNQVTVREPDEEENGLRLLAAVDTGAIQRVLPYTVGISGITYRQKRTVVIDDYVRFAGATPESLSQGMKSAMGIPLEVDGRVVAVVSLLSRMPGHFTQARVDLVSTVCGIIGLFLELVRLRNAVAANPE